MIEELLLVKKAVDLFNRYDILQAKA